MVYWRLLLGLLLRSVPGLNSWGLFLGTYLWELLLGPTPDDNSRDLLLGNTPVFYQRPALGSTRGDYSRGLLLVSTPGIHSSGSLLGSTRGDYSQDLLLVSTPRDHSWGLLPVLAELPHWIWPARYSWGPPLCCELDHDLLFLSTELPRY